MAKPGITFKNLILCDEVRREDNGKLFFIGVYQDQVLPHSFPAKLKLSLWIPAVTNLSVNDIVVDISLKSLSDGKEKGAAKAEVQLVVDEAALSEGETKVNIWLSALVLEVEEPSELIVRGKIKGGRYKLIETRRISPRPEPPSESVQPS